MAEFKLRGYTNILWDSLELELPLPQTMGKKTQENNWTLPEVDIRLRDVSQLDLSAYDIQYIAFDERTKWTTDSTKLPKGYESLNKIFELGKNPGLGIRSLHEKGIDGSGMSMAIIDQPLSDHVEIQDNLVYYEEFGYDNKETTGKMHGLAVASIAVGKNCGVAPKAKLYYFAANNKREKNGQQIRTSYYKIQALERIMQINESLPDKEKIQIVSMSAGWMGNPKTEKSDEWHKVLEKAKKAGLFVLTTASSKEYGLDFLGLGKQAVKDPEDPSSYTDKDWGIPVEIEKEFILEHGGQKALEEYRKRLEKTVLVPMEHRTIASPTGKDEYVHYFDGGMSWATPWLAASFVLARQVDPTIMPEDFWEIAIQTGVFNEKAHGTIIQPIKLIDSLQKGAIAKNLGKRLENGVNDTVKLTNQTKGKQNAK